MAPGRQVEAHDPIVRLEKASVDGEVGWRAAIWLNLGKGL
jgi:hypothetical protein